MDGLQAAVTSLAVIAIVLLMAFFVCHFFGPRATAWVRSNREEKIGLSKNKLFNANGYLIQSSGSDFLLSSTGSFKRFDSVDRECKDVGQSSLATPPWKIPVNDIPPQPLRPSPSPPATKVVSKDRIKSTSVLTNTKSPIKQQSLEPIGTTSTVIPRPVARRQLSTPVTSSINVPGTMHKIHHGSRTGTNPFLNGSLSSSSNLPNVVDSVSSSSVWSSVEFSVECEKSGSGHSGGLNPFAEEDVNVIDCVFDDDDDEAEDDHDDDDDDDDGFGSLASQRHIKQQSDDENIFQFTPSKIEDFLLMEMEEDKTVHDALMEVEGSIRKLESVTLDDRENRKDYKEFLLQQQREKTASSSALSTRKLYQDSVCADASENLNSVGFRARQQQFSRNRSLSETEVSEKYGYQYRRDSKSWESQSKVFHQYQPQQQQQQQQQQTHQSILPTTTAITTSGINNPFINNSSSLHKTLSEAYLEQYSLLSSTSRPCRVGSVSSGGGGVGGVGGGSGGSVTGCGSSIIQTWSFGKSLSRQGSATSLTKSLGSQSSVDSETGLLLNDCANLKRAVSCESVSSESSVVLADLEQTTPPITGYLCIGLQYDKNNCTDDGAELVVTVLEAKELIGPPDTEGMDTFVRIYLVPDETGAMQTKLFKNSPCPSYNETFSFWLNKKRSRRSLWFHLYHSGMAHTLIGEAEMQLCDVTRPITTWLALSDSRHNNITNWGELMFSLSYLPTAERLTVVVVKARNLKISLSDDESDSLVDNDKCKELQNVFVKVYLLKDDKKVSKKKTSMKRKEKSPIYNESMIFSVPPYMLASIQIRLTVVHMMESPSMMGQQCDNSLVSSIGHVIVGGGTSGKGLRHWNQMMSSLRKPVAMWHPLRRSTAISRNQFDVT